MGFWVTSHWESWFNGFFSLRKLVSGLLPAGGEGVFGLLPAGEVGFMITSCWGSWFQGYFCWGRGWVA